MQLVKKSQQKKGNAKWQKKEKKREKKNFRQKVKKKSTDVGVYKIRKVTKFGNMKKRRDKILEKKSKRFHKPGEIQNPGDTNQNLELGKKAQQA